MTCQFFGSVLFDRLPIPERAKVECCRSRDEFGCQFTDCSATRILSSSITGHHPQRTGSLVGGGLFWRGAVYVFSSPNWQRCCVAENLLYLTVLFCSWYCSFCGNKSETLFPFISSETTTYIYIYIYIYVCVCVCVCVSACVRACMCVYVCICVSMQQVS